MANYTLSPTQLRELSPEKAAEFFESFIAQIPQRILELEAKVRLVPGYEGWAADFTESSLDQLGQWFCEHITTRPKGQEEIEAIYAQAPTWFKQVQIEEWELTDETFSLAMDIGIYIGRMLELHTPGLKWKLVTRPSKDINYQQPVLGGKRQQVFNPLHILTTYAYAVVRKSQGPDRLKGLFRIWSGILASGPQKT